MWALAWLATQGDAGMKKADIKSLHKMMVWNKVQAYYYSHILLHIQM